MAGSGRPAAREAGLLKTCPVAAPAAARGRCMAGSGLPTARELAGISYRSTACNRRTCSQSKNPGCCRIADTEPNNLRELRKSPSSSLIYPTSCHSTQQRSRLPLRACCASATAAGKLLHRTPAAPPRASHSSHAPRSGVDRIGRRIKIQL